MSVRAVLRKKINGNFLLDADIDALMIDYFPDVWASISRGMSRVEKINQLLSSKSEAEIEQALDLSCRDKTASPIALTGSCQDGSARFLQEIARLRHIIQELEQQLAHKAPDTLCVSRDGLDQLVEHRGELDRFLHPQSTVNEVDWMRWTYESLHTIEVYFGKYHHVASSFRFACMIEKSGPKDEYKGLLDAAINIMRRELIGSERAEDELEQLSRTGARESIF